MQKYLITVKLLWHYYTASKFFWNLKIMCSLEQQTIFPWPTPSTNTSKMPPRPYVNVIQLFSQTQRETCNPGEFSSLTCKPILTWTTKCRPLSTRQPGKECVTKHLVNSINRAFIILTCLWMQKGALFFSVFTSFYTRCGFFWCTAAIQNKGIVSVWIP